MKDNFSIEVTIQKERCGEVLLILIIRYIFVDNLLSVLSIWFARIGTHVDAIKFQTISHFAFLYWMPLLCWPPGVRSAQKPEPFGGTNPEKQTSIT